MRLWTPPCHRGSRSDKLWAALSIYPFYGFEDRTGHGEEDWDGGAWIGVCDFGSGERVLV